VSGPRHRAGCNPITARERRAETNTRHRAAQAHLPPRAKRFPWPRAPRTTASSRTREISRMSPLVYGAIAALPWQVRKAAPWPSAWSSLPPPQSKKHSP
jgi:hypothetical protein